MLLFVLLASGPPSASLPAVHDSAGSRWALVHAGQLWVCWEPGVACFERVVLDDLGPDTTAPDTLTLEQNFEFDTDIDIEPAPVPARISTGPEHWRLGFAHEQLWIEVDGARWRIGRGQRVARATFEFAPVHLERARIRRCSPYPRAQLPVASPSGFTWMPGDRCAPRSSGPRRPSPCFPAAPLLPRIRHPTALRLRAGVQIASARSWAADARRGSSATALRERAGVEFFAVLEFGFDPAAARSQIRARAALERRAARLALLSEHQLDTLTCATEAP